MNSARETFLTEKFGNRVSFRKTERKLYGHDIAAIPSLIKPLVGDTTPEVVVQPESEAEVIALVRWAAENRIPLTPRGKATSGYGGVLPVRHGVVVDFYRMKRILKTDGKGMTVTVQPGAVWEKVERELQQSGLALRLYPTSCPASTVAGWLAQGGAGIGSYQWGWFRDNVVSARVVAPDGKARDVWGDDLDLVADAEGITGLITEVTLKVRPAEELSVAAVGCKEAAGLQELVQAMVRDQLPIWSLVFINPRMAEFRNRVPLKERHGQPAEERVILPGLYIATLAFRKTDEPGIKASLKRYAGAFGAEVLSDRIAAHEWENRFKLMMVKRLGPSLAPAEVVVPLSKLGKVMDEIERKVSHPVVKEGVVISNGPGGQPEVAILGLIPSDQRSFSYNFIFGLVLTVMRIAEKHGSRPYSTGLYFASKAGKVLGTSRLKKLAEHKKLMDPLNIMNPGKVTGLGVLNSTMRLADALEPAVRLMGNRAVTRLEMAPPKPPRNIPSDVAYYAYSCSQCGYCIEECDQFYGRGWESQSPRGKWYWLREYIEGREKWDQFMVDSIISCTTCEMCNNRCSVSLPIESSWLKLRGELIGEEKKMTFPPFEMMAAALTKEGNIWAGYRKNRSDWFPVELLEKHGPGRKSRAVYFAGCTASYVEQDIGLASVRLLDAAGVDFTYLSEKENCCGTPMLVAGKWDVFAETIRKNIEAVREAGADTIITSCPACDMMWRHTYATWAKKLGIPYGIKTKHYSEVIAAKILAGDFRFPAEDGNKTRVTWHDSCHLGRVSGVYEPPRDLIRAIPGADFVEMPYNREDSHCCGSVLTLIKEPAVAADVGKVRLDEAVGVGAEKVLALCPCCEFQLRVSAEKKKLPIEVVDLARFAAEALGYKLPDPNPEVRKQWAVFEAMIALMTPHGFAKLMGTMWPEMVDAMPYGMGKMMRAMGRVPGAMRMMKPAFPVLFPRLLPMMMPKVMPVMLQRVSDAVPMPDYMREQMPDLMPKVMANLMPHMIGELVPLVTQPMIDYLHGKTAR